VLEQQARRIIKHRLTEQALAKLKGNIAREAERVQLPQRLRERIAEVFKQYPDIPWDHAVAQVLGGEGG